MRAVWLSSTYYLDPAVETLSANAERLFTRALAYCGNAETSGYVSESAIKKLGLRSVNRLVTELVRAGIWLECEGGGWLFKNWASWQSKGDALLERRRADRERQARKRNRDTKRSRDTSRDVTAPEESRGEEIGTYVPRSSNGSNARTREEPPRGPSVSIDAVKLVRATLPAGHPPAVHTALALEVGAMLVAGTPETDVRAALGLWLDKPKLGPSTLPSLVSEVVRSRDRPRANGHAFASPADERFAQAQALRSTPIGTHPLELQ